jgi:hypothetical protein
MMVMVMVMVGRESAQGPCHAPGERGVEGAGPVQVLPQGPQPLGRAAIRPGRGAPSPPVLHAPARARALTRDRLPMWWWWWNGVQGNPVFGAQVALAKASTFDSERRRYTLIPSPKCRCGVFTPSSLSLSAPAQGAGDASHRRADGPKGAARSWQRPARPDQAATPRPRPRGLLSRAGKGADHITQGPFFCTARPARATRGVEARLGRTQSAVPLARSNGHGGVERCDQGGVYCRARA